MKSRKCRECDGLGEWEEGPLPARSPVQESPEYNQVTCPECEGEGEVFGRCDKCEDDGVAFNDDGDFLCPECLFDWSEAEFGELAEAEDC